MGQLLEGRWHSETDFPTDEKGEFVRWDSSFRDRITADGSSGFEAEAGRYHLYVAHACPWAHRTLIARALLGLEDAISVSLAHPLMLEHGWVFRTGEAPVPDPIHQADYLWQVYVAANPDFTGRVSVPVLWDRKRKTIVNNESRDILQMFSREMRAVAQREIDLAPPDRREEIERVIDAIYQPINNGVYRAGFAKSQAAHERAVIELFDALDHWEDVLSRQRYTCGNVFTEADICLFTTLFRFDIVYVTHFKCNVRRVGDYPNLWGFVRDIYQMQGVARTCDIARTKQHYFGSHPSVNPTGIIPLGPAIDYDAPHERDRF